jgi:hypothetical protein
MNSGSSNVRKRSRLLELLQGIVCMSAIVGIPYYFIEVMNKKPNYMPREIREKIREGVYEEPYELPKEQLYGLNEGKRK